ncbi:MAG: Flp pilus assembly complex ATPase component TadA [Candidatus Omnitrophica bacterium]|nr:Flp pilus assembly complex ATPase component TadA [Candidatus Omnitrophota bacterium]
MGAIRSSEEKLVEEGLITAEQLNQARAEAARKGQSVRQALVSLGAIDPKALAHWLSRELNLPQVELKTYLVDTQVVDLIPEALARKHRVIPLFKVGSALTVATADPLNLAALDDLRLKSGLNVEPVVATDEEIGQALEEYYGAKGRWDEMVSHLTQERLGMATGAEPELAKLKGLVEEPPIVRLVNLLLADAIHCRASDIHLEPERELLKVRFRVDGLLRESSALPKHLESAVISRIKILASLDIAERRKPQDGRFRVSMEGHEVDLRVSVMPAIDGETVVLRLLDASGLQLDLNQLGMEPELLARYQTLLKRPWGILLVTGPTGSGKTTTLYASLATLNAGQQNIVTIEDPVEYRLKGIRQIPINPAVGLTFASGLRSILRQDPDVILVGEIRDRETAETAVQAALTGHLVLSTLHTNDAPTAITRLIDMGMEPFLVASSVIGVAAQRLVRTVCPECKAPRKGCRKCGNTGYKGRIGVFELMVMNDELGRLTVAKAPTDQLRACACRSGMRLLREDGMLRASSGLTTPEEVLRVT